MKVKFYAFVGYYSGYEEIVDLPDDFTDEDIEREFLTWCDNYVEYGWHKEEDE